MPVRKTAPLPKISNIQLLLERFEGNPILRPDRKHQWETKAAFNPAAIYEGGRCISFIGQSARPMFPS